MKPLEDELRSLLRREEPPEGFTERVLARAKSVKKRESLLQRFVNAFFFRPLPRWAATVAIVCVLVGIAYAGFRGREERRGEMARAEAIQALRFASAELNVTLQKALLNGPVHLAPAEERNPER